VNSALRPTPTPDPDAVAEALRLFATPGALFEIRVPHARTSNGKRDLSRLFGVGDFEAAAEYACSVSGMAPGVYVTLNPVDPSKRGAAGDKDILHRRLLLIDVDPERPAGTSATDAEKERAGGVATAVWADLEARGWPSPIRADSGNGFHALYAIDLPNDTASTTLVRSVLNTLAEKHNIAGVKVDTTVSNASRICKLYGTVAAKGEPTAERPHRLAVILHIPATLTAVTREQLQAVADEARPSKPERQAAVSHYAPPCYTQTPGGQLEWKDILGPKGWSKVREHDGQTDWTRPGKSPDDGHSATTNNGGGDKLRVFSGNAPPFETGRWYTKIEAVAVLDHGGDIEAARVAMMAAGYDLQALSGVPTGPSYQAKNGKPEPRGDDDDDGLPIPHRPWPAGPSEEAYHGLAGRIVRTIEPETEADSLAILAQFLVMVGNVVGRGPHVLIEETEHYLNEFAVLVGDSSVARKGTAADRALKVVRPADELWATRRIMAGLSSGEGLIAAVRDPTVRTEAVDKKHPERGAREVLVDEGVQDKRLLILESEFGRTLRVQGREGNTLSALIRLAWDGKSLSTLTKSSQHATNPHISIIGHITGAELESLLSRTDELNGYANRFLWFAVRRSKNLPRGGRRVDLSALSKDLAETVAFARGVGELHMSPDAWELWESQYARLNTPPPGPLGSILSRAAPHTLRLAAIYALLDRIDFIMSEHLRAALALWDASAGCAAYIFGQSLGNPDAEKILAALRARPAGMTRSEIRSDVFNRNRPAAKIKTALALLMTSQHVREERDTSTGGAPALRYHANALDAINAKGTTRENQGSQSGTPYSVNGVNGVADTPDSVRSAADHERFVL
jgi:hypothetical protein